MLFSKEAHSYFEEAYWLSSFVKEKGVGMNEWDSNSLRC